MSDEEVEMSNSDAALLGSLIGCYQHKTTVDAATHAHFERLAEKRIRELLAEVAKLKSR